MTIAQDSTLGRVLISGTLVFAGAVSFATGIFVFSREPDASRWFDVDSIQIQDSVEGVSPSMSVSRTILRAFHGNWYVTVAKEDQDRGFYTFCTAAGQAMYVPDRVLPSGVNLDWWTWPTKCNLSRGVYRVDTTWQFHPPGYNVKEVTASSNTFTVRSGAVPQVAP